MGEIRRRAPTQDEGGDWSGEKMKRRLGRPSRPSQPLSEVLRASNAPGSMGDLLSTTREAAVYESAWREPLGQAWVRGHEVPAALKENHEFSFGRSTGGHRRAWHQSGKEDIAPTHHNLAGAEEEKVHHEQYVRSHRAFAPGEQARRRYQWPGDIARNTSGHSFGVSTWVADGGGVREAMKDHTEALGCSSRVVSLKDQEFQKTSFSPLGGRPAPSRAAALPWKPPNHAFGLGTMRSASAGELIRGDYSQEEQLPDRDLGRCVKPGRRNVSNESRAFGKSFRRPEHEFGAVDVLYPGPFAEKGITREDFVQLRSKHEVKSLFECAGCSLAPDEFENVWESATKTAGTFEFESGNKREVPLAAMAKAFAEHRAGRRLMG